MFDEMLVQFDDGRYARYRAHDLWRLAGGQVTFDTDSVRTTAQLWPGVLARPDGDDKAAFRRVRRTYVPAIPERTEAENERLVRDFSASAPAVHHDYVVDAQVDLLLYQDLLDTIGSTSRMNGGLIHAVESHRAKLVRLNAAYREAAWRLVANLPLSRDDASSVRHIDVGGGQVQVTIGTERRLALASSVNKKAKKALVEARIAKRKKMAVKAAPAAPKARPAVPQKTPVDARRTSPWWRSMSAAARAKYIEEHPGGAHAKRMMKIMDRARQKKEDKAKTKTEAA